MNYFSGPREQYKEGKAKKAFDDGKAKSGGEVWIGGAGTSLGYYDPAEHSTKEGLPSNGMGKKENIHCEYQPIGYQEDWVNGVECANGHKEQLLTATFKARRAQLDQYFAPHFKTIYPDRPADHVLP